MTEVVAAPPGQEKSELTPVGHWIGGAHVAGRRPLGARLQPGHRRADEGGCVRLCRGGGHRCRDSVGGLPCVARHVALEARRLFRIRAAVPPPPRGDRPDSHRRARQGALGRHGRGTARPRGDRVRMRDPDPNEGQLLRAGRDRHRRLLDPPAARRRRRRSRRSTSPRWCPVDVGARAHLGNTIELKPSEKVPRRRTTPRSCRRSRGAARGFQRRPGRQGGGGLAFSTTPR